MKNLENFGFVELEQNDLVDYNGGFIWFLIGLVIATVNDISIDPEGFKKGYNKALGK